MPELTITPNIEASPWSDLQHIKLLESEHGQLAGIERVGRLPRGTQRGNSSVSLLIKLPSGKQVMAQTTLRLFLAAAKVMEMSAKADGETLEN